MENIKELIWLKNGRKYNQIEDSVELINELPKKVYSMCLD